MRPPLEGVLEAEVLGIALAGALIFGTAPASELEVGEGIVGVAAEIIVVVNVLVWELESVVIMVSVNVNVVMSVA